MINVVNQLGINHQKVDNHKLDPCDFEMQNQQGKLCRYLMPKIEV